MTKSNHENLWVPTGIFAKLFKEQGLLGFDPKHKEDQIQSNQNFKMPKHPQATLDLHGYSVEQGLKELADFIKFSREKRFKKILVITGVGKHSDGGKAKLRPYVRNFLQTLKSERRIKDFEYANPEHGSFGASYIYI